MSGAGLSGLLAATGFGWDDRWLDPAACALVVAELEHVFWRRSQVVEVTANGLTSRDSAERTSRSATARWFGDALREQVWRIEARLADELGVDVARLEGWQALSYGPGDRFGAHHDGGHLAAEPGGERVLTFLLCVQAPTSGGQTYFPELDLLIEPLAGRLLVWRNLSEDGTPDRRMTHAATPVHDGRKLMLTTWSRQRPVRPTASG